MPPTIESKQEDEDYDSYYEEDDGDSSYISEDDDDDEDEDDDNELSEQDLMLYFLHRAQMVAAASKKKRFHSTSKKKTKASNERPVKTQESELITQRNAEELVAQEEREKKKAVKKREKKKRRREKKKEKEKATHSNGTEINNSSPSQNIKSPKTSEPLNVEEDDEFLDPNSAFVSVAVSKSKKTQASYNSVMENIKRTKKIEKNSSVAKSEKLALLGITLASKEQYEEAVKCFTDAIQLVQDDHRFFGNRSFCFCQLGSFMKALKDAEKAISLAPENPKNHYRRGAALLGLKDYKQAQQAFEQVLQLDDSCEDARQELEMLMVYQLAEMGFKEGLALKAVKKHCNLQAALDELMSVSDTIEEEPSAVVSNMDDIYYSDEEVNEEDPQSTSNIIVKHSSSNFTAPRFCKLEVMNPDSFMSLWVGNISPGTTEQQITDLFSRYGSIASVKVLPEKFCAFVNYRDKSSSALAMRSLQGTEFNGDHIMIRYPKKSANPQSNSSKPSVVKSAANSGSTGSTQSRKPSETEECHFWRTSGCLYGDKCRFRHVKENKGIDRKPWHKVL